MIMTRPILPLSAACFLLGACAAPKAEVVEDPPAATPSPKPEETASGTAPEPLPPPEEVRSGLRLPPGLTKFPEEGDFKPGAAATRGAGAAPVISTPPPAAE